MAATLLSVFPIIVLDFDQSHWLVNHFGESAEFFGSLSTSMEISVAQVHLSASIITYLCWAAEPLQYSIQRLDEIA